MPFWLKENNGKPELALLVLLLTVAIVFWAASVGAALSELAFAGAASVAALSELPSLEFEA